MIRIRTLLPLAAVVFAAPLMAQQNPAASHNELLQRVEETRAAENNAFQDRRAEYEAKATQAEKDALLRQAEQRRHAARHRVGSV